MGKAQRFWAVNRGGEFVMVTAPSPDWINLQGKTLAEVADAALRASFARHRGDRRAMMDELGVSEASLRRKLERLGMRA